MHVLAPFMLVVPFLHLWHWDASLLNLTAALSRYHPSGHFAQDAPNLPASHAVHTTALDTFSVDLPSEQRSHSNMLGSGAAKFTSQISHSMAPVKLLAIPGMHGKHMEEPGSF
jgi:hypothetical protein